MCFYGEAIASLDKLQGENPDQNTGIKIIAKALEEPLKQIAANAGFEGAVVLNKVLEGKNDFGFNAATEVYENLIKSGVIDPTKVARTALENAASVSALLLTTEAVVYEKKEEKESMPQCLTAAVWTGCIKRKI